MRYCRVCVCVCDLLAAGYLHTGCDWKSLWKQSDQAAASLQSRQHRTQHTKHQCKAYFLFNLHNLSLIFYYP